MASTLDIVLNVLGISNLQGANQQATQLQQNLTAARNAGLALAGAGAGMLALSTQIQQGAVEAAQLEARLESILKVQGALGDKETILNITTDIATKGNFDDATADSLVDAAIKMKSFSVETQHMGELLEDASRQAITMGTDVSSVSEALAKAYASGNVAALKRSGVVISQADIDLIDEAYAKSQKLGQQKFVDIVGPAIRNNTAALEDSLDDATKAANNLDRAMSDAMDNMGKGAASVRTSLLNNVALPIATILAQNEGLGRTVGVIAEIGGVAASGAGSVLALGGQIGLIAANWTAISGAASATWASIMASGGAAFAWIQARAIATFAAIQASATATTVGLNLATAGVTALAAGFALALGAIAYRGAQALGWLSDEQTYVERLAQGWSNLKDIISGTNSSFRQNEVDLAKEIENVKFENAKAVTEGSKTQDQADEDNRNKELELRNKFAAEQLRIGDKENFVKNQEAAARLKKQSDTANSIPIAVTPGMPVAPVSSLGGQALDSLGAFPVAPLGETAAIDNTNRIRALEDQKKALTGKANAAKRDEITAQILVLRRQEQDSKKGAAAAKAAQSVENKQEGYELDVDRNRARLASNEQLDNLQMQLDAAKEAGDAAAVRALVLSIEEAKANRDFAIAQEQSAKEAITDIAKANSTLQIAKDNRADALRRAVTTAQRAANGVKEGKGGNIDDKLRAFLTGNAQIGGGLSNSPLNPLGGSSGFGSEFSGNRKGTVQQSGVSQAANGESEVTIKVKVPYQGIAFAEVN